MEEYEDYKKHKKWPVFIRAMEIMRIASNMSDFINERIEQNLDNHELFLAKERVQWINENSMIIPAKIAGLSNVELYDIRMENASIIRKAAREIQVNCTGLKSFDIGIADYVNLLRDEVELFRVDFAEWVKTFDTWNYVIDRWGLFNPPGVNYYDKDPDDDLEG
jgi:hypothetical protein